MIFRFWFVLGVVFLLFELFLAWLLQSGGYITAGVILALVATAIGGMLQLLFSVAKWWRRISQRANKA